MNFARKDIICNEEEQKNFQAKYSKKLPCTGEELDAMTWDDFENVGEFFQRKKGDMLAGTAVLEDDFYGIAYQAGKGYDFSSMQINGFIWQMGGNIWDETQVPNGQAEGVVNSPEAVAGARELPEPDPVHAAGGQDRHHGHLQVRRAVPRRQGGHEHRLDRPWRSLARSEDLQGFRQAGLRPDAGHHGSDGKMIRWSNIGGQPFVLTTWTTDAQIKEAVEFVKWWLSPEIQHQFAAGGGQSAIKSVYEDPKYVTYRPWNRAWAPSARLAEGRLARAAVLRTAHPAAGPVRPCHHRQAGRQDDLDNIAKFQQNLLTEAGLIQ